MADKTCTGILSLVIWQRSHVTSRPAMTLILSLVVLISVCDYSEGDGMCGACMNGGRLLMPNNIFGYCRCRCAGDFKGPRCQFLKKRDGNAVREERRTSPDSVRESASRGQASILQPRISSFDLLDAVLESIDRKSKLSKINQKRNQDQDVHKMGISKNNDQIDSFRQAEKSSPVQNIESSLPVSQVFIPGSGRFFIHSDNSLHDLAAAGFSHPAKLDTKLKGHLADGALIGSFAQYPEELNQVRGLWKIRNDENRAERRLEAENRKI